MLGVIVFVFFVVFFKVYNEQIRDLLANSGPLAVREDGTKGVVVQGLTLHQVMIPAVAQWCENVHTLKKLPILITFSFLKLCLFSYSILHLKCVFIQDFQIHLNH